MHPAIEVTSIVPTAIYHNINDSYVIQWSSYYSTSHCHYHNSCYISDGCQGQESGQSSEKVHRLSYETTGI